MPDIKDGPMPPIGSIWRHSSGVVYAVYDHLNANEGTQPRDDYPPMIAYISAIGRTYTRRADDWHRSFDHVAGPYAGAHDVPNGIAAKTLLAAMNHMGSRMVMVAAAGMPAGKDGA